MIFGSTMLEVAIGLIFVYLLMSLLCSAFSELINALFRLRAKDLEKGIARLLDDSFNADGTVKTGTDGSSKLSDRFFKNPLVVGLAEKGKKPSYIPSRIFSLALWNMATDVADKARAEEAKRAEAAKKEEKPPAAGVTTQPPAQPGGGFVSGVEKNLTLLRSTIQGLPDNVLPRELKQSLVTLMDEADNNFDKARENIERWYDDAMDRVSGAFRRRAHYILLGLGFALALAMNVDSFNIFKVLYTNDDVRKSVVTVAEKFANEPLPGITPTPSPSPTATPGTKPTPSPMPSPAAGVRGAPTPSPTATPSATTSPTPTPSPTPSAEEQFDAARERIKLIKGELTELGLPIGWDCGWHDGASTSGTGTAANTNANGNTNANRNVNGGGNANAGPSATPAGDAAKDDAKWQCSTLSSANPRGAPEGFYGWLFKLAGIFLTALAVSQGAPFWFDMLNKIIVIRSTVKPKEKSPEQPSKDKPAPETEKKDKPNENPKG
jgi:hypothetical protein